jgi:hypothetical protein
MNFRLELAKRTRAFDVSAPGASPSATGVSAQHGKTREPRGQTFEEVRPRGARIETSRKGNRDDRTYGTSYCAVSSWRHGV